MKVHKVLGLLEQLTGPDIMADFQNEQFAPSPDDAFIVALSKDDNENDVALDIISRNPLYTELSGRDELIMNVRQIANYAFLHEEYEEALNLYNIAIDITKSLPILFNSRALCYIREILCYSSSLNHFKRAIIDCDYVINKLDEKNLNAWLFRAKGYHGLGITSEYEKCVAEARKNHPKRIVPYINDVVRLISTTIDTKSASESEAKPSLDEQALEKQ